MVRTFNVSFDEDNLKIIDDYRKSSSKLSRSKFLETVALEYIKAKTIEPELKKVLDDLSKSFQHLAERTESIKLKSD